MNTEDKLIGLVESGAIRVSDNGEIWFMLPATNRRNVPCRAEKWMPTGYGQVRASVGGIRYNALAHRLVWRALRGQIPLGCVINHINGNKSDNRPENLEVATPSENTRHAHRTGLKDQRGERNPASKFTDNEVARLRIEYACGGVTQAELARRHSVSFQAISKIVRGQRRRSNLGPTGDYTSRRITVPLRVRDVCTGKFMKEAA